ncbi:class V lanthionine synthetase subunit LxmK [Streptomyces sp. NBC_01530]|uniref:class V lanthionine synthetase subunit LxmK n=1 Tax=Streptomyces sp. NBC_01530 TaxID=2903895 RepID=UPI00386FDB0B
MEKKYLQGRPTAVPAGTLVAHPDVEELLSWLSLGSLGAAEVFSFPGRNDNWSGVTDGGHAVFVKRLSGKTPESLARFRRVLAFENSAHGIPHPVLIGSDEESRLLVFEFIEDGRSGNELAADDEFTPELSRQVGEVLARLHDLDPAHRTDVTDVLDDPHSLPPVAELEALPLRAYLSATGASLQAWGLLQRDAPLVGALRALRDSEAGVARVPGHGDFRLDQLLVRDGTVHVTDWEEFRLMDPARDVGAWAGEWLYRAVLRIPVTGGEDDGTFGPTLSHDEILQRGQREIARVLPLVGAFWDGYRAHRPTPDPALPVRATAYAGWHLIDRLLASTRESARLSAIVRAAAGIGRTALLDPERFTSAVGLGDAP